MRVFIVHRDIDYEFGEVWGVFLTLWQAEGFVSQSLATGLTIEEWETEGNEKMSTLEARLK